VSEPYPGDAADHAQDNDAPAVPGDDLAPQTPPNGYATAGEG
jgi:hypothetical protein